MKARTFIALILFFSLSSSLFAQQAESAIRATLTDYIQGTSYNYPERIKAAFHETADLYLSRGEDPLFILPMAEYAAMFEKNTPGSFTGRVGQIISIDRFQDIATAKVEILVPGADLRFIDMFLLKEFYGEWKIISKTASSETHNKHGNKILFVVSNAEHYGDTDLPTGNSFDEIINAYEEFDRAGYNVDFVSPRGGSVPLAYVNSLGAKQREFLYNADFMSQLKHTFSPDQVSATDYKAVYFVGGGAAMFGIPENEAIQAIAVEVYEKQGGIISAVCHGSAGIVNIRLSNGEYLVKGKQVNGFPDEYEAKDKPYYQTFPFAISPTLEDHGGSFVKGPRNNPFMIVDGNLITGQNSLSSGILAKAIIDRLAKNK